MEVANSSPDPMARMRCVHSLPAFRAIFHELVLLNEKTIPVPVPVPVPAPVVVTSRETSPPRIPSIIGAEISEDHHQGVKVVAITPNGPCDTAGVFPNDRIIMIDNHPITCRADLRGLLAGLEPRTIVTLILERHSSIVTLPLMLGEAPTRPWTPTRSGGRSLSPSHRATSPLRKL
eukprot:TRINITY_DN7871_c0_g1_i1.p1 TRINITY_DN7871_c0_g1~~TRINITY_DN7871_c0_g1_i1.p1  ORF type:complete len:188 (+),score=24.83 TRINITY_DN7871_c0_g1_i1:38-565(+)